MRMLRGLAPLVLLISLAAIGAAHGAIAFDSSSSISVNEGFAQWSHTVGAGTNRLLVVGVSIRGAGTSVTTVTYGSQGLTFLGARNGTGNRVRIEIWYLVAPASGTDMVTVNLTANEKFVVGATSYSGVLQSDPLAPFISNIGRANQAPTITFSSAPDELALEVLVVEHGNQALVPGAGESELWDTSFANAVTGAASTEPGASSVTMSWTKAQRGYWAVGATSIRPSGAELTLTKTVSAATAVPGDVLSYALIHTNNGPVDVFPTFTIDPIPANTDYQLGSAIFLPGTSGLTATIEFSDDGGGTYGAYTPVSGGGGAPGGFDRNVTHVRYTFNGTLGNVPPDHTMSVQLGVRVR